jgi:hypothetical protein
MRVAVTTIGSRMKADAAPASPAVSARVVAHSSVAPALKAARGAKIAPVFMAQQLIRARRAAQVGFCALVQPRCG